MAKSYAPEVTIDNSDNWYGNALRFPTREEAEATVAVLSASWWLAVRDTRVVESNDPPNYHWTDGHLVAIEEVTGKAREREEDDDGEDLIQR